MFFNNDIEHVVSQVAGITNRSGNASGELNHPWGIYVTSNHVLYIVDQGNHRVQKWLPGELTVIE